MSVMWAVLRGARRLGGADPARRLLPPPLPLPARSPAPWLAPPGVWSSTAKAAQGPRKDKRGRTVKRNADKQEVEIQQRMTVAALAQAMKKDCDHVFEAVRNSLFSGKSLSPDSVLDEDQIKQAVKVSGMKFKWANLSVAKEKVNRDAIPRPPADPSLLVLRPPVVTIMGHVDHGKTTLLDSLRKSQLAAAEAGGITQHIGAFLVTLPSGEKITFLDTPGHAAFSSMRARGARATDMVILVVATDDGVMHQTVESIQHARRNGVPIIVALNKCDRQQSEPERVKRELQQQGLLCEDFGGDVQTIHISALKGDNLPALTEAVAALAEVLELKADPGGPVEGLVIESSTDKGKGFVTTAIVQRGTLKKGCVLVAGKSWAKVRLMLDENGGALKEAGPGRAVEVVGWRDLPSAGDLILEVESEQRAREVVEWREKEAERLKMEEGESAIALKQEAHLQEYRKQKEELSHLSWRKRRRVKYLIHKKDMQAAPVETPQDRTPRLTLVIKGDVDGSVEAILNILDGYDAQDQCDLDVVHWGLGDVSENDVNLAETFAGTIYGFNVGASRSVQQAAEKRGVSLRLHTVIYKLVDQLKDELSSKLPSVQVQNLTGRAQVRALFEVKMEKKKVLVAGCRVLKGQLDRRHKFRQIRGRDVIWEGSLLELRHHKEEVQTVSMGMECGLLADDSVEFRADDVIECFVEADKPQVTSWNPGF